MALYIFIKYGAVSNRGGSKRHYLGLIQLRSNVVVLCLQLDLVFNLIILNGAVSKRGAYGRQYLDLLQLRR